MEDHSQSGNMTAGNQTLRNGIALSRTGIATFRYGNAADGISQIQQGRVMMGQGLDQMMGCAEHAYDGGMQDGGMMTGCSTMMMGNGSSMMMDGLAKFDGAWTMMMDPDAGTTDQAMGNMETGMQMMEQGAGQMMGSMGMM